MINSFFRNAATLFRWLLHASVALNEHECYFGGTPCPHNRLALTKRINQGLQRNNTKLIYTLSLTVFAFVRLSH